MIGALFSGISSLGANAPSASTDFEDFQIDISPEFTNKPTFIMTGNNDPTSYIIPGVIILGVLLLLRKGKK